MADGAIGSEAQQKTAVCRNARLEFRRELGVETGERGLGRVTVLFLCLFENSFGETQGGERRTQTGRLVKSNDKGGEGSEQRRKQITV